MEVRIWKRVEGVGTALFKPSPRSGFPPLMLRGRTPKDLRDKVAEAVRVVYGTPLPAKDE